MCINDLVAGIDAALEGYGGGHGEARGSGHQPGLAQPAMRGARAGCRDLAHGAHEAFLETGRRIEARELLPRGLPQREKLVLLLTTSRAASDVALELDDRANVELVVQPRADQTVCLGAGHAVSFCWLATMSTRSCARARDSRDITVPMGTPATSAISL